MATTFAKETFSAASYAAFRPSYPHKLYSAVLAYHTGPRKLCVDLGTGHGISAKAISANFEEVIGTDPSGGMIEQAQRAYPSSENPNLSFYKAGAEALPFVKNNSTDLVIAAQSSHWFDYSKVFPELERITRPGSSLAFWGYQDPTIIGYAKATSIFLDYVHGPGEHKFGQYWGQPGRSILNNKLHAIKPPEDAWENVQRLEYEPNTAGKDQGQGTKFMEMRVTIKDFMNYVRTWSPFHSWQEKYPDRKSREEGGEGDVIDTLFDEMAEAEHWTDFDKELDIEFGTALLMARRK